MERENCVQKINPNVLLLPDNAHWSSGRFERYMSGVKEHEGLIDINLAPGTINLENSIVGKTADNLAEKLAEGIPYEYASQIRRRRDGSVYATSLVTGRSTSMTFTRSSRQQMSDTFRASLFNINCISRLSRRFPPETLLFELHSHPFDTPVHHGDVEKLLPVDNSGLVIGPFRQMVGTLIVGKSVRMLTLATKQTPQFGSYEEKEEVLRDIKDESGQAMEKLGANTLRSLFDFKVTSENYPELVRTSVWSWTRSAHRMNYLMYTSLVSEGNSNLYIRSF